MIGYLKGTIIYFQPTKIILSVQNTGYEINFINQYCHSDLNVEYTFFIVQKYSEYGIALYGFRTIQEKLIFEVLESIKGVGSKVIFTIMSYLDIKEFSQLQELKLEDLVKLPGVGKTTAQKFLLALSGKLKKEFDLSVDKDEKQGKSDIEEKYHNEINLLVEWGMKKSDIVSYLKENKELIEGKSSEQIIRIALQKK